MENTYFRNGINIILCLFFLTVLATAKGYNYAPFILSLVGLGYTFYALIKKHSLALTAEQRKIAWVYIFYWATFILTFLLHDEKASFLDKPTKALLFLLLFILFNRYPPRLNWLFHAIPYGALIAGLVALYHRFILEKPQAFYNLMHIQGGDMAMSIAMFSLIITLYFAIKKSYKLTALYLCFSLMGILAGFLSTARGAWVGFPFIILFILIIYRRVLSRAFLGGLLAVILALISVATLIPNTQIMARFHLATTEISDYIQKDNGSTSVGARFDMWKSAWLQFQEKPLLGWGEKGVKANRLEQGKQGIISDYAAQFSHVHNQYLDDFSKRGIVGLAAFLSVLALPFYLFFRRLNKGSLEQTTVALIGCVHILSVSFYCLSQSFFAHNSGTIFYFFLIVVFYAMLQQTLPRQKVSEN